ncbi:MAG: protein kinase [Acidobacteriota bacterium]
MGDLTGQSVGRYRVGERLGAGAMGEVYKALDTTLKRPVAIKRLSPDLSGDPNYRHRLLKEAQHAARLNHPCIAAIHDILEDMDDLFLVMEFVQGKHLLQSLGQPLDIELFLTMAVQCAEALVAAHEKGIVHGDIKPANILLSSEREVKFLDFGVARRLPASLQDTTAETIPSAREGTVQGTPAYMSPQVLLGKESDPQSDIFSLGVVFYEVLTGHHPFLGKTIARTADSILHQTPAPLLRLNPNIPEDFERIVEKMLAKDPGRRYASAADLLVDLRRLGREQAEFEAPGPRDFRWRSSRITLAVALLLVVLLAGFLWWGPGRDFRVFRKPLPDRLNVALLPITTHGGGPQDEAFAAGLHAALNHKLSRLTTRHPLTVSPATLLRHRRVHGVDQIGIEVGANLALKAVVTRSGNQAQIAIGLLEEGSGQRLRSTTISGSFSDSMALELQLAQTCLQLLGLELRPRDQLELTQYGTRNPASYHLYLRGLGYLTHSDGGDVQLAVRAFEEALSLAGNNFPRAQVGLGEAYWIDYGRTRKESLAAAALNLCTQAARGNENLAEAEFCLGRIAQRSGRLEEALQHLKRAYYIEPTSDDIRKNLAGLYVRLGRQEEAEKVYRDAVTLQPEFWRSHSSLGVFLGARSRFAEAAEELRRATQLAPEYYRAFTNLAVTFAELSRWQEAREAAEKSISIKATGKAYSNLATAYFYQGFFRKSVETYNTAILYMENEKGLEFTIYGNLADALYWAPGQREKAQAQYLKALKMAAEDLGRQTPSPVALGTAMGRMATYAAMLGRREQALEYLAKALAVLPRDGETMLKAALVHEQFGQVGEALKWLSKALKAGVRETKVRSHPMFASLLKDPEYQALFEGR